MRESICVHGKLESQGMLSGTRARRNSVGFLTTGVFALFSHLYMYFCVFY